MSENGEPVLTTELRGHVLLMGLNRPAKRNAFNVELLESLGRAYERLEREDDLRAGVLHAHGDHFTGGLDLAEVAPRLVEGTLEYPDDARDPWRYDGKPWTKPVIVAVQAQRLYELVTLPAAQQHRLTLLFAPGLSGYAFTFG